MRSRQTRLKQKLTTMSALELASRATKFGMPQSEEAAETVLQQSLPAFQGGRPLGLGLPKSATEVEMIAGRIMEEARKTGRTTFLIGTRT